MKLLLSVCLWITSASAFAASSVAGSVDYEIRELYITILDDPNSAPFEAASFWNVMVGTDSTKIIKTQNLEIACKTLLTQPLNERFGSCQIVLKNIQDLTDSYGILVSGAEAQEILRLFVGRENSDYLKNINLELSNRQLWVTASHTQGLFAFRISKALVKK